jgi:hypothetical protein
MAGLRGCQELRRTERYDYIGLLREAAEIVALNPLLSAPIRDVSDIVVVQTAIIGEAAFLSTRDRDFYTREVLTYLEGMGTWVLDHVALIHRLRATLGAPLDKGSLRTILPSRPASPAPSLRRVVEKIHDTAENTLPCRVRDGAPACLRRQLREVHWSGSSHGYSRGHKSKAGQLLKRRKISIPCHQHHFVIKATLGNQ